MSLTLAALVADVRALLPQVENDTGQSDAANRAVTMALETYSQLRPCVKLHQITADGIANSFALPSDFVPPFSNILRVESPLGSVPPSYLPVTQYQLQIVPDVDTIRKHRILFLATFPAGQLIRIEYTAVHSVSGLATSVPESERTTFGYLAAYHLANFAVGFYGSTTRSTLGADIINYRTKADEWQAIADHFYRSYKAALGMRRDDAVLSAAVVASFKRNGLVWRR